MRARWRAGRMRFDLRRKMGQPLFYLVRPRCKPKRRPPQSAVSTANARTRGFGTCIHVIQHVRTPTITKHTPQNTCESGGAARAHKVAWRQVQPPTAATRCRALQSRTPAPDPATSCQAPSHLHTQARPRSAMLASTEHTQRVALPPLDNDRAGSYHQSERVLCMRVPAQSARPRAGRAAVWRRARAPEVAAPAGSLRTRAQLLESTAGRALARVSAYRPARGQRSSPSAPLP